MDLNALRQHLGGPALDSLLTPPGMAGAAPAVDGSVLATYRGPGREQVLTAFERIGRLPEGAAAAAGAIDEAARLARDPASVAHAVQGGASTAAAAQQVLPMAAEATVAGMPYARLNIHQSMRDGLLAQALHAHDAALSTAHVAAGGGGAVTGAGSQLGAAARIAPDAAAAGRQSDDAARFVFDALDELSTADPALRMDVLSQAVYHRSTHGTGEPIERLLATSLLDGPADESASSLRHAIGKVVGGTAAALSPAGAGGAATTGTVAAAAAAVAPAAASARVAPSLAPASGMAVPSLEAAIMAITRATPRI